MKLRRNHPPAAAGKQPAASRSQGGAKDAHDDVKTDWGLGLSMAMYVYSTTGDPVGFLFETTIYDMDGTPLARIVGSRVHHFDGAYAGEWYKDMVVRHPQGRPRMIPPVAQPGRRSPAPISYRLRAVVDYGYPDVFPQLRQSGHDAYMDQAAE